MATTEPAVVCDAGPIIHLDELGCLDLLSDFRPLLVPPVVWDEIVRHRVSLLRDAIPNMTVVGPSGSGSARLHALEKSLGLHAGERAALTLLEERNARLLLCDDAAARIAAESLGFPARGTLGVLVRSIRARRRGRAQVLALLDSLPAVSTLHLSPRLLKEVIAEVKATGNSAS